MYSPTLHKFCKYVYYHHEENKEIFEIILYKYVILCRPLLYAGASLITNTMMDLIAVNHIVIYNQYDRLFMIWIGCDRK